MKICLPLCLILLVATSAFTGLKNKLRLPEEFVRIPAGTMSSDSTTISIHGFYMSKYEVSNLQYQSFIDQAYFYLTEAERQAVAVDTNVWEKEFGSAPMKKFYYGHERFHKYPVVNISHEGARLYCEWLQKTLQEKNPGYEIEVKLPARQEWIWAAMGGRSQAIFPWGNYYLRNGRGEFMCNFRVVSDGQIYRNRQTGKVSISKLPGTVLSDNRFTAPVKSFYKNDYGLYNMCGNAAEMVAEKGVAAGGSWNDYGGDVHTRAQSGYERPLPTVGFRPTIFVKGKEK